jgi:hypothetical protein
VKNQETKVLRGNWPPKMKKFRYVPITGDAWIMPWVILRPVPESRSSGRP